MRAKAEKSGTTVIVQLEMAGWHSVRFASKETPSSYFMEITDRCVC